MDWNRLAIIEPSIVPVELSIRETTMRWTVMTAQAMDLDDASTVTIQAGPYSSGDTRAMRGGVYVDIPREAFYRWLYGTVGVQVVVEPLSGWQPLVYLDFDEVGRHSPDQVFGLEAFAQWRDGRQRRVTMTVDELWAELVRLSGQE